MTSMKLKRVAQEAQKAALLEEAHEQLREQQGLLAERKKLEEGIRTQYYTVVALQEKFARADNVQREDILVAERIVAERVLADMKQMAKELPKVTDIRSQIKEIESRIQELSTPTYIDRVLSEGPPSAVEKKGLYDVQTRVPGQPLYECCFPAAAQPPLPLTLAHDSFGKFLDDFNDVSAPLDDDVCNLVVDLCFDVLGRMQHLECEEEFQRAFNLKVEGFLQRTVSVDVVTCRANRLTTDSTVREGAKWIHLGELKLESGGSLAQGLQSFAFYVGSLGAQTKTELLPCFFMEVIGPTIRIGGFVLFEKVAWQPLTPFINCIYTDYDRTDMATLCRAMRALKKGLTALASYYNEAHPSTPKDIPYPLQGRLSDRIGDKLIFIVTLDDGERRIFKYCRQYGERVHRSWAEAGLAPLLYDCKRIAGDWLEVQMQYLADWSPSSSLLKAMDGPARLELQKEISAALEQALAIQIDNCPVAHGDMRSPNVMIKREDGGRFDIKFIDFDWSGKVGVARYPPFMNKELEWHPDVGAGKLLAQDHDKWWWKKPLTGAIVILLRWEIFVATRKKDVYSKVYEFFLSREQKHGNGRGRGKDVMEKF